MLDKFELSLFTTCTQLFWVLIQDACLGCYFYGVEKAACVADTTSYWIDYFAVSRNMSRTILMGMSGSAIYFLRLRGRLQVCSRKYAVGKS